MYAVLQKNMTRNMSIWDLKNTVVGSWPLKNIFIRFKKKEEEGKREKNCLSPQLPISGQTDTAFNERGQFQTSFQNTEALQVIGIISSLDMQIKFQLEMTELEKQPQQEREKEEEEERKQRERHTFVLQDNWRSAEEATAKTEEDTAEHVKTTTRVRGQVHPEGENVENDNQQGRSVTPALFRALACMLSELVVFIIFLI